MTTGVLLKLGANFKGNSEGTVLMHVLPTVALKTCQDRYSRSLAVMDSSP